MPTLSPEEASWLRKTGLAFQIVRELLGDNVRANKTGDYSAHPVWRVGYLANFDLDAIKPTLCARLDAIECQFVTTGEKSAETEPEPLLYFAVAPLLFETPSVAYHATPVRLIPVILGEGLLPSDAGRSLTDFPDTLGKIHASLTLTKESDKGDPAAWWRDHLSERYREPFGIIAIDLSTGPPDARVYRDTHSHWGVVIDRVDRIPPHQLREVRDEELSPALPAA